MPAHTTVGQLLINDALPEELRDDQRVLDKKGMTALLRDVALRHPDRYKEVSHRLAEVGYTAAQESGGNTFGLIHLRKSPAARAIHDQLRRDINQVLDNDKLDSKTRHELILRKVGAVMKRHQDEIYHESLDEQNPLAHQVLSGSRGNPMNLASLRGGDLLYTDQHDRPIPLPVLRSYSEGLTPAEYFAGAYGARKGVMATKFATRSSGYLGKQLAQVSHRLIVTDHDAPENPEHPGDLRGLPVDTTDPDNEGALLARAVGPYGRNTHLTPKVLHHLARLGHEKILIRSPAVGGSPEGGIYSRDAGARERGTLPGRGEQVGLAAANALAEPLSQGALSTKHSGGVAGEEKVLGGFAHIDQLIQTPKTFKGGAAHARVDGHVGPITDAPAGGQYVSIDGERHWVAPGFDLMVKKGDQVEAGDVISEGIPNPAVITQHKGVGEGRRYFVRAMRDAFHGAGLKVHRRNLEVLARGLINHVHLTEETDDHVPGDVIPYSTLEHTYSPREGYRTISPKEAVGSYLERPYLHHSIGTKVRPSMLPEFEHFGVDTVDVHHEPPPFEPVMIRGMASLQHDPDWLTQMYGSGLKKSLLHSVHRGGKSDERGTSFVPGLARAVDFGRDGLVRTPEPGLDASALGATAGFAHDSSETTKGLSAAPRHSSTGLSETFKRSDDLGSVKPPSSATPAAPKLQPPLPSLAAKPPTPGPAPAPAPNPTPPPAPNPYAWHNNSSQSGLGALGSLTSGKNPFPAGHTYGAAGYDAQGNYDFSRFAPFDQSSQSAPASTSSGQPWWMRHPVAAGGLGLGLFPLGWAADKVMKAYPGLTGQNYSSLGRTIQQVPIARELLGFSKPPVPPGETAAAPSWLARTFPRIAARGARAAALPGAKTLAGGAKLLGKGVAIAGSVYDAGYTANELAHGRSAEYADQTAQLYRDRLAFRNGANPLAFLGSVTDPATNLNLIGQGAKQTVETAGELRQSAGSSQAQGLAEYRAHQANPARADPFAPPSTATAPSLQRGGDITPTGTSFGENVNELARLKGVAQGVRQTGLEADRAMMDARQRQLTPLLAKHDRWVAAGKPPQFEDYTPEQHREVMDFRRQEALGSFGRRHEGMGFGSRMIQDMTEMSPGIPGYHDVTIPGTGVTIPRFSRLWK